MVPTIRPYFEESNQNAYFKEKNVEAKIWKSGVKIVFLLWVPYTAELESFTWELHRVHEKTVPLYTLR